MIVDTILKRNDGDYIKFKNTLGKSSDGSNEDQTTIILPLGSPELNSKFYFVHLKLKSN